jgi:hypothetical protein
MKVSYGSSLEPILEIWPQTFGEKTFGNFNHYAIQILGERTGANLGFPFPPIPRHFSFAEVREFSVVDVTPHPVTIGWMGSAADAEAEKVQALEHRSSGGVGSPQNWDKDTPGRRSPPHGMA